MYKMRLQELCQQRKWALPKYTGMKCGPDHAARFGASVSVNGTSFDSLATFNSSKQAFNCVAMLALHHFTSPSDISIVPFENPHNEEKGREDSHENDKITYNTAALIHDTDCRNKIQLLKYAKHRNLDLPSYSTESGGPTDSLFKAKVRVSEQVFESPISYDTSEEAESEAAKTALMSLLLQNSHKHDLRGFKSLLQELAQGEGFGVPVYRTKNSGVPHSPAFSSVVDLEGEIFHGKAAKSKKLAELEAARTAYLALTKRGISRSSIKPNPTLSSRLTSPWSLEQEDNETEGSLAIPSVNAKKNGGTGRASSSSDLLCNKVRVYREFPSLRAFPERTVVLPLGEDKWVAMSLEFPNEVAI